VGLVFALAASSGCAATIANTGADCTNTLRQGTLFVGAWGTAPPSEVVILTRDGNPNRPWRVEPHCRAPKQQYAAMKSAPSLKCTAKVESDLRVGASFRDPSLLEQLAVFRGQSTRRMELNLTTSATLELKEQLFVEQLEGPSCAQAEAYVRRVHLGTHELGFDSSDAGSLWSRWFGADASQSVQGRKSYDGTPILYEFEWIHSARNMTCPPGQIANPSTGRCENGAASAQFELGVSITAAPAVCWRAGTSGPCQLGFDVLAPVEQKGCWFAPGAVQGTCTMGRLLVAADLKAPLRVDLHDGANRPLGGCGYSWVEAEVQKAAATSFAMGQAACGFYSLGWTLRAKR
jgi:hypothetical protein